MTILGEPTSVEPSAAEPSAAEPSAVADPIQMTSLPLAA
jgi:hypothetical protein